MAVPNDLSPADMIDECTTTLSFADHGIDDGHALLTGTYARYRNQADEPFTATDEDLDRLEVAFIRTYLDELGAGTVDDHVRAALDDTLAEMREQYAEADDPDLRTDVIPTFYQQLAAYHCDYRH